MTTDLDEYDETNEAENADLLVGHRIVEAEMGKLDHPGLTRHSRYGQGYSVSLMLSQIARAKGIG